MSSKKNRKKLYYNDVDTEVHRQIRLLSIITKQPMYTIVNEVLRQGIKVYMKEHGKEIDKKAEPYKDII